MRTSLTRGSAGRQPALALSDHLIGSVERITFRNEETGFAVLRVKARGHRQLATVVGHVPDVALGEMIEAAGNWLNDRSHGVQFRATEISTSAPTTVEDLERYLGSGVIKGVGPACARRLVSAFGTRVLDVIERTPDQLAHIHGIGPSTAQRIAESWARRRTLRKIAAFLRRHGINDASLMRIYRAYGPSAVEVISGNPYQLSLDIAGFDFDQVDKVAASFGIARTAPVRLQAGLSSVVMEAVGEGHCGLPVEHLIRRARLLLGVPEADLDVVLDAECVSGRIVADTHEESRCLFPKNLFDAEAFIASRLRDLSSGSPSWGRHEAAAMARRAEALIDVPLSRSQRDAVICACRSKVLVVTGGPGVGKTTLIDSLTRVLRERNVAVALCAPTGRAAKRLSEATGFPAKTIHRLLEASPGGFRRNAEMPIECDFLVVDEVSMVDVRLMTALLRALPDHAALLMVGDVDQLPSIGPGQVLADVIGSGTIPVVRLTEVFRQAAKSRIIAAAHAINCGEMPDLKPQPGSDFFFVSAEPADTLAKLCTIVRDRIPSRFGLDPVRDIQVLCPVNRGAFGAHAINAELQRILNPPGESSLFRAGWYFGLGDKVMQVRNNYEKDVYNGEIGIVSKMDRDAGELAVAFDDREVIYGSDDIDELVLAYATTVHKAQGSEYPAVVIPITDQHRPMLQRSLLYTGVTRGSRLVVLLGSRATLADAVKGGAGGRRWSRLKECLRLARGPSPVRGSPPVVKLAAE